VPQPAGMPSPALSCGPTPAHPDRSPRAPAILGQVVDGDHRAIHGRSSRSRSRRVFRRRSPCVILLPPLSLLAVRPSFMAIAAGVPELSHQEASPVSTSSRRTGAPLASCPITTFDPEALCGHSSQKPRAKPEPARTGYGPSAAKWRQSRRSRTDDRHLKAAFIKGQCARRKRWQ
jgi:hypothetical protein